MAGYRDDRDALRLENERLEADLDDTERELAEQKTRVADAERALASQQAELAAKEAELARLRPAAAAPVVGGVVRCPGCGRENASHLRFCMGCGAQLTGAPPAQARQLAAAPDVTAVPAKIGNSVAVIMLVALALLGALFVLLAM